jgi:hypothetical protein
LVNVLRRPRLLTLVGVVVTAGGFLLIAIAWGRTAGEASIAAQIPDLIAAGITGIALVVVGLLAMNVDARQRDAAEERLQAEELHDLLRELQQVLERSSR